ncbi:MAG: DUF4062 domain-containing protein, partial [Bacteroidota bacterium]
VVSPPYMASKWCARELDNFIKAATDQGGLRVENDYRIFKINKFPVDRKTLPEELQVITGFNFYEMDSETRQVDVIDPSLGDQDKKDFYKKVYQVAVVLAQFLESLSNGELESTATAKDVGQEHTTSGDAADSSSSDSAADASTEAGTGSAETSASSRPDADGRVTVYLPYTTRDLREVRESLQAELVRRNCIVLPDQQYPWEYVEEFQAAAQEDLQKADISIHLVGSRYGTIMEGATQSIVELQNEWAVEESKKRSLRRLIWMPREMENVREKHADFLQRLKSSRELLTGADLMEDTVENLKSVALDMLSPPKKSSGATDGESDTVKLYLLHDASDKDFVRDIRKKLRGTTVDGKELKILRPVFDGEAAELREIQQQRLRECDGVLVIWGNSSQAWLESSLSDIRKAPGFGREKPYAGKHLVYLAGEQSGAKEDWFMDFEDDYLDEDLDAVEAFEAVPVQKLEAFLKTLI